MDSYISRIVRTKFVIILLIVFSFTSILVGCANRADVRLSVSGYNEQHSDEGKVYYTLTIKNEGKRKIKISTVTPLIENDMPLQLDTEKTKVGRNIKSGEEQTIAGEFVVNVEGYSHEDISRLIPLIKKYEVEIDNKSYVLKAVN